MTNYKSFLSYSRGFYYLCLATMCEKFSFHAIRFSNIIYMTKALLLSDTDAYLISGSTLALTFIFPIVGGYIADKIIGYYRICLLGAAFVSLGISVLILPHKFSLYLGMGLVSCGGGFLRAGIPALASLFLEEKGDRRDAGFTILYSFINMGAFLAVFGGCVIGEIFGWEYNFIISSIVGLLSILFLNLGKSFFEVNQIQSVLVFKKLSYKNKLFFYIFSFLFPIVGALIIFQNWIFNYLLTCLFFSSLIFVFYKSRKVEYRECFLNLALCMIIQVVFFAMYEQGASSVNLFIDRNVDRSLRVFNENLMYFFHVFLPFEKIPATAFQSLDPLVNIILGVILGYLWWKIAKSTTFFSFIRFGFGLIIESMGYFILSFSGFFVNAEGLVSFWLIPLIYMCTVAGELLVVPLGMSMVTKIAPKTQKGLILGFWNLSIAVGQWTAGVLSCSVSITDKYISHEESIAIYSSVFYKFGVWGIIYGVLLIMLTMLCFYLIKNYSQKVALP